MEYKISRFVKLIYFDNDIFLYHILKNALGEILPENKEQFIKFIETGNIELTDFFNSLIDEKIVVPKELDEDNKMIELANNFINNDNNLRLIIIPTLNCNFSCTYCHQIHMDQTKSINMDIATLDNLLMYLKNNAHKYSIVAIDWFGGEPLLTLNLIKYFYDNFKNIDTANIYVENSITTNAYLLTPELFETFFNEYNIKFFFITVDGLPEYHDRVRVLNNGGPTFSRILSNILYMKSTEYDFKLFLRANIDRTIVKPEEIENWIDFYNSIFNNDERFEFPLALVYSNTMSKEEKCAFGSENKYLVERFKILLNKGVDSDILRYFGPKGACYSAEKNSFVIYPDGTLCKCAAALKDLEQNIVGKFNANGDMILNDNYKIWLNNYLTIDDHCLKCFFAPSCLGGSCPYMRIVNENRRPCVRMKSEFEEVMRLHIQSIRR